MRYSPNAKKTSKNRAPYYQQESVPGKMSPQRQRGSAPGKVSPQRQRGSAPGKKHFG